MEEGGKEVGGFRAATEAEVGDRNSDVGAHHRQCAGTIGWVGVRGEGEGVEMEVEEMEMEEMEAEETGAGTERDREGDMEVEETLKEAERVEKDVMEE